MNFLTLMSGMMTGSNGTNKLLCTLANRTIASSHELDAGSLQRQAQISPLNERAKASGF
jgi:hypothetical protein